MSEHTDRYNRHSGGKVEDMNHLPLRFPSDVERRRVTVDIFSYTGLAVGAVHWYAEVEERDNSYVDHEKKVLRTPWGVEGYAHLRGQFFKQSCATRVEAEQIAREMLKKHFSPDEHYIFVKYDKRAEPYRDLGFQIETMGGQLEQEAFVRMRLAARYKTGDI